MSDDEVTKKVLRDAVELLRTDGWHPKMGAGTDCRRDILGALFDAASQQHGPFLDAFWAVQTHLDGMVFVRPESVEPRKAKHLHETYLAYWNDRIAKSADEVIELLLNVERRTDLAHRPPAFVETEG